MLWANPELNSPTLGRLSKIVYCFGPRSVPKVTQWKLSMLGAPSDNVILSAARRDPALRESRVQVEGPRECAILDSCLRLPTRIFKRNLITRNLNPKPETRNLKLETASFRRRLQCRSRLHSARDLRQNPELLVNR